MYPLNTNHDILGSSPTLNAALRYMEIAALAECVVLLQGETGTGKELFAKAIHQQSPRRTGPFIKVNCAAIPSGLLESELFGHEKGAYTGAVTQTHGRFQLADRGTLFLDEIGDLPLELQPKLLRVLQENEFERLGSSRTIQVDVRVVAATHQNLSRMVEERRYRADLFYRLNVFPISIPALRDRADDLLLLVRHFVQYYAALRRKVVHLVSDEFMQLLRAYHWPGNIRELQNIVERSVLLSETGILYPPPGFAYSAPSPSFSSVPACTLAEAERLHIAEVLRRTNWTIGGNAGAAALLGITRSTLLTKMQKHGIALKLNSSTGSRAHEDAAAQRVMEASA